MRHDKHRDRHPNRIETLLGRLQDCQPVAIDTDRCTDGLVPPVAFAAIAPFRIRPKRQILASQPNLVDGSRNSRERAQQLTAV